MSKNSCLYIFGLLLFSSCKTYMTPAISGNNMSYMAKPMLSDEKHIQTYATGTYAIAGSPEQSVLFDMGLLNLHRSHTYKSINFSYGVFGYLGNASFKKYKKEGDQEEGRYPEDFKKSISGLGLKTSIGYQIASSNSNTNFRIINWENSISTEMGDYVDFRKQTHQNGVYSRSYASNKKNIWTTGLSTEIIWHSRRNKDIQHSFRFFIGGTPGLIKSFDDDLAQDSDQLDREFARAINYYIKIKQFSLCIEFAKDINLSNKVSLGYSF